MYQHSIGVPLILSGPGIPAGRRENAQCYLRDLYPTLCDLAGIALPADLDGKSLVPVLKGASDPHEFVVGYFTDTQRMIRTDRWKLIRYLKIHREQLFDLANDPDELNDLIADPNQKAVADKLRTQLTDWLPAHGDPN